MKRPSSISETISEDDTILPSIDELELDEDQCTNLATCFTNSEKKRRLGVDQVRALERHFEMENKLDPDRKTRLAVDLGLQPRQVAIWFQNRRARSKTKNLEKDFNGLKSRYDELLGECESLRRDKEALTEQLKELESKLDHSKSPMVKLETNTTMFYRDGASDSDSSIVFNEESIDQCFIDTYPTNLNFSCKGFLEQNFDLPNDEQNFDLTNDEQEFCTDTRFFSHEPISDLSPWNGSEKWVD